MAVVAGHTGKPDIYHPPLIVDRPERRCLFTIAVGEPYKWMFDITIPHMRAYCEKHNIDFIVVDDNYRRDEHPCYMKQFINTLWWRYDRVCYVDSDVLIMPHAPNIFDCTPADKCCAFRELEYSGVQAQIQRRDQMSRDYITLYAEAYNERMIEAGYEPVELPENLGEYYYNAGIFVCTRETCPHVAPVAGVMQLPTSNHYDQNYFNMMIIKHKIPMHDLGYNWNRRRGARVEESPNPLDSYFVHYLGLGQKEKLKKDVIRMGKKMYQVHFVGATRTGDRKWILERMQDFIIAATPEGVPKPTIEAAPIDAPGHVNVFNPYRYYKKSQYAKDIVFFTHPEDLPQWEAAHGCDCAVVMCEKYRDELIADGMEPAQIRLIHAGVGDIYKNARLRVLNVGRMEANHGYMTRKGIDTWKRLQALSWMDCINTGGDMTQSQVYEEYLKADVVVSTALVEGGPMSCYEALSMGKPYYGRVGVGVHDEIEQVIKYHDDDELEHELYSAYTEKLNRAMAVKDKSWNRFVSEWWKVIGDIAGEVLPPTIAQPKVKAKPKRPENEILLFSQMPRRIMRDIQAHLQGKGYVVVMTPTQADADIDLSYDPDITFLQAVRSIKLQMEKRNERATV
jgi:hypothetical protein